MWYFGNTIVILGLSCLLHLVLAYPLAQTALSWIESSTLTDPLSKYTEEYFRNHMLIDPTVNCLFYTYPLTKPAHEFARSTKTFLTIWDLFPCSLYDDSDDLSNPLKDIMHNATLRHKYFQRMSGVMAEMCTVVATVMAQDTLSINHTGIYGTIEEPILQRPIQPSLRVVDLVSAILFTANKEVIAEKLQIEAIEPSGCHPRSHWDRSNTERLVTNQPRESYRGSDINTLDLSIVKSDLQGQQPYGCFDARTLADRFDDIHW